MKKFLLLFVIGLLFMYKSFSQIIPYGTSTDSTSVIIYEDNHNDTLFPNFSPPFSYQVYYYKPSNYDSLTSPIILFIHALNGTGAQSVNIQAIADRRNALIVAPSMDGNTNWPYLLISLIQDSIGCYHEYWMVNIITQIYNHVLQRENRTSVPVYLTGFSAGGQFVTRYMLLRQAIQDSIPIKMAVSVNPASYTFCTDSLNAIAMTYPCGLLPSGYFNPVCIPPYKIPLPFCNEHIMQYYNENYGVLIGTADTANFNPGWQCMDVQGQDRYERTRNFYNFSDTNAITRGTTLQWQYDSVIGVDHNGYNMYNTKRNVTDTSTIAETLLFDTPWHPVPSLAPLASFTADTTIVTLPTAAVQFTNNSINATSYLWDFGDGTTSTAVNPLYIYTYADTFTVKLTAGSGSGCDNTMIKRNYIIVKNASGVNEFSVGNGQLAIYPNPTSGTIQLAVGSKQLAKEKAEVEIYNVLGERVYQSANQHISTSSANLQIDVSSEPVGIYIIKIKINEGTYYEKIIKE